MGQTSMNLDVVVRTDGYSLGGGTTKRTLIVSASDMTLQGGSSASITFPSLTGSVILMASSAPNTFTQPQTFYGNVYVTGSIYRSTLIVNSTPWNLTASDNIIFVSSAAAITLNLPDATTVLNGKEYYIKDYSGNANTFNITVTPNGAQKIDGAATNVISTAYGSIRIFTDTANWFTF